jgi:phage baseplate assembly protein W
MMADRYLMQRLRYGAEKPAAQGVLRNGLAVTEDPDQHLRDKILAVLFTAPGERMNRPNFGVGLKRVVFEPLDDLTLGAIEFRITEGLRREVGDEILLDAVDILTSPPDGELRIAIHYRRRQDRIPRNLEIEL